MARKKRSRKKNVSPKALRLCFFFLLIFLGQLFFYAWSRIQCTTLGYQISENMNQQTRLLSMQNNLKIELARLKAPERIARIAREKLDLVRPTADQFIKVP